MTWASMLGKLAFYINMKLFRRIDHVAGHYTTSTPGANKCMFIDISRKLVVILSVFILPTASGTQKVTTKRQMRRRDVSHG
jgi:hypothetical protein